MSSEVENTPLISGSTHNVSQRNQVKKRTMIFRAIVAFSILIAIVGGIWIMLEPNDIDFSPLEGYCFHIKAIPPDEYVARHKRLAQTLKDEEADALIMEGGATMTYYTNIKWELTERAFITILRLDDNEPTGIHMTLVTPAFEATRAMDSLGKANLPHIIQPNLIEWLEHKSPFDAVKKVFDGGAKRVIVEQKARLFIYQGVSDALKDIQVDIAPQTIRMLRMIKSKSELEIMRCANRVTELAIRTMRPYIQVGMTEFDIQKLMETALHKAGLTNVWVYALLDENAGLPHGDSSEKKVTEHSTVLIDTGGELLGYQSDTTRTFFMSERGYNQTIEDAWYLVRRAQENVLNLVGTGMTCAQVDLIARHIIDKGGFGSYFTHRLGHGIGKEMHEEPYMNQGNTEQFLLPGMTFSVEPGVYLKEFGIRLEDVVFVREDGKLELLTNGLAQNPWTLG